MDMVYNTVLGIPHEIYLALHCQINGINNEFEIKQNFKNIQHFNHYPLVII